MEDKKVDYMKLRGRIVEKYKTISAFAIKWGKSNSYVASKLNGSIKFTYDDITEWSKLLDIEPTEIGIYFFAL